MAPFPRSEQASNSNTESLGVKLTIAKRKIAHAFKHNVISKKLSECHQNVSHYLSNSVLLKFIRDFCSYFLNSKHLPCTTDATAVPPSETIQPSNMEINCPTTTYLEEHAAQYCAVRLRKSLRFDSVEQDNVSVENTVVIEEQIVNQQNSTSESDEDENDVTCNMTPIIM